MAGKEKEVSEEQDPSCHLLSPLNKNYFPKKCHDYKTNLNTIHLKDAAQLFFQSIVRLFIHKEKGMTAKVLNMIAAPVHDGEDDGSWGCASSRKTCLKDAEYFFT